MAKIVPPQKCPRTIFGCIFCPMGQNVAAKNCPRTLLGCNIQSRLGQNCPRTNSVYLRTIFFVAGPYLSKNKDPGHINQPI